MKVILITDTHLGIKKGNAVMMERQYQCWEELVEKAVAVGITTIIHLGDFFDDRNSITIPTIRMARKIAKLITESGLQMMVIAGNHDVFYKNRNDVNTLDAIFSDYPNIVSYDEPTTVKLDGVKVDLIPWINASNFESVSDFIGSSTSPICCGHFEFSGFPFHKGGRPADHGMSTKLFSNYEKVFTGHYHTRSKMGNIEYIGSGFEYTWADWNDRKGFVVLDLDKKNVEHEHVSFTPETAVNFVWIHLQEDGQVSDIYPEVKPDNRFVRITVEGKPNKKTEKYITEVEKVALSVDVMYVEEVRVDKDVVLEDLNQEDVMEDVVVSAVANTDIRAAVLSHLDLLKREVE